MLQKLQNKPVLSISILVIIMLGLHLDVMQVSIMEARNFITAREMLIDNNWLLTTMNGEARYQKPPLPSWICACFGWLFGIQNLIAMRLPAVFFVAIIGVYTYFLSERLTKNKSLSFNNALIIITSFYVIGIVFEAPSDIFTHGFMLIGIYHLFQLFQKNSDYLKHSLIGGLWIGCSILSKGPVSFYALLLPFLIAYGFSFKYKFNKRLISSFVLSLIIAVIVGGWWYLYVRVNDTETFQAIAERETANWSNYNTRPFYYYWSFFVQSGIWTIPAFISLLYPYMKSRVSNVKAYKFSFYWTIFAVLLLTIIPEKKSRYLMPVLIPLAINTGFYIQYLIKNFRTITAKRETFIVYFNFGLIALIAIAFPIVAYIFLGANVSEYWLLYVLVSAVSIGIGLLIIIQLKKSNISHVFKLTTLFFISLLVLGLPLSEAMKSENYHSISNLKSKTDIQDLEVYSLNYVPPQFIWLYGQKILPLEIDKSTFYLKANRFGVLSSHISPEVLQILKRKYSIENVDTYDLNLGDPKSKSYNDRLKSDFYIFTKL